MIIIHDKTDPPPRPANRSGKFYEISTAIQHFEDGEWFIVPWSMYPSTDAENIRAAVYGFAETCSVIVKTHKTLEGLLVLNVTRSSL